MSAAGCARNAHWQLPGAYAVASVTTRVSPAAMASACAAAWHTTALPSTDWHATPAHATAASSSSSSRTRICTRARGGDTLDRHLFGGHAVRIHEKAEHSV